MKKNVPGAQDACHSVVTTWLSMADRTSQKRSWSRHFSVKVKRQRTRLVTHVCGKYRILDTEFEKKLCNQCEQLLLDNYELIPDTTHHVILTTRQLCQRVNMSTLTQRPTCQQGQQGLDNHSYRRVTVGNEHVQLHCTPLQEV